MVLYFIEIILNHYPNKPQHTLHVSSSLDRRYILQLFLQSMQVSFQLFRSSIQVEFSIYKATKGKSMLPNRPSMFLIAYSFLTPHIFTY